MRLSTIIGAALVLTSHLVAAQTSAPPKPLLQVEVADSIGLPLPDAKTEEFTLMDGGTFREWVLIEPGELADGVHLLRFSNDGYRSAAFSVPLRKGSVISLRVRLGAQPDTTRRKKSVEAVPVNAIGLAIAGRTTTDIIKSRHVLERDAADRANAPSIASLLRIARGLDVLVSPLIGDNSTISSSSAGGGVSCSIPVMINGDRRWLFSFTEANHRFVGDEVEMVELIPRSAATVYVRRREDADCGLLMLWMKPA